MTEALTPTGGAGAPEPIAEARRDVAEGRVGRKSLRTPSPAVFLDRDGVLNEERGYIRDPDALTLLSGVGQAVRRLNASDYSTVVVTNQAVVARGECDEADLARIHARLDRLLGADKALIDRLYYCPHHPDSGLPGGRADLKIACACRKPGTGMVLAAQDELNLDLAASWMVGDTTSDMEMARRAGLTSILVRTGHSGRDGKCVVRPDFVMDDLSEAVDFILDAWPPLVKLAQPWAAKLRAGDLVLIGGPSRSGKTTLAQALAMATRSRGLDTTVLRLDDWILSEAERGQGVLGRYDMAAAETFILTLTAGRDPGPAPLYDPTTRAALPKARRVLHPQGGVLIVEGGPALLSETLRDLAAVKLQASCDEAIRRERFFTDYRRRGLPGGKIEDLYRRRMIDEAALMKDAARHADAMVETRP